MIVYWKYVHGHNTKNVVEAVMIYNLGGERNSSTIMPHAVRTIHIKTCYTDISVTQLNFMGLNVHSL